MLNPGSEFFGDGPTRSLHSRIAATNGAKQLAP
jgi:hypothetical protein